MSLYRLRKEITKLENRLDRITSDYDKAQSILAQIHELEAELEYRLARRS